MISSLSIGLFISSISFIPPFYSAAESSDSPRAGDAVAHSDGRAISANEAPHCGPESCCIEDTLLLALDLSPCPMHFPKSRCHRQFPRILDTAFQWPFKLRTCVLASCFFACLRSHSPIRLLTNPVKEE
ncbi:hypothetical protein R1flu_002425 [Riccia fluitans]|uniref:Secreted protein n=1 Tax=Riccia fluitans TaxID=41844 RepID=A0ABD1Y6K9_9MARC